MLLHRRTQILNNYIYFYLLKFNKYAMNKLNILEILKSVQISFWFQIKLCGVQKNPNVNKTFINGVMHVRKP
jgi:hypothetical protein